MSLSKAEFSRPTGSATWDLKAIDAKTNRDIAYEAHLRLAQQGVVGWQDLPNRLREAYRSIHVDLYSRGDQNQ